MKRMTPSEYIAVTTTLYEERILQREGVDYSEAVIEMCESWLRMFGAPVTRAAFSDPSESQADETLRRIQPELHRIPPSVNYRGRA